MTAFTLEVRRGMALAMRPKFEVCIADVPASATQIRRALHLLMYHVDQYNLGQEPFRLHVTEEFQELWRQNHERQVRPRHLSFTATFV